MISKELTTEKLWAMIHTLQNATHDRHKYTILVAYLLASCSPTGASTKTDTGRIGDTPELWHGKSTMRYDRYIWMFGCTYHNRVTNHEEKASYRDADV